MTWWWRSKPRARVSQAVLRASDAHLAHLAWWQHLAMLSPMATTSSLPPWPGVDASRERRS
jgi:hypothetical protein